MDQSTSLPISIKSVEFQECIPLREPDVGEDCGCGSTPQSHKNKHPFVAYVRGSNIQIKVDFYLHQPALGNQFTISASGTMGGVKPEIVNFENNQVTAIFSLATHLSTEIGVHNYILNWVAKRRNGTEEECFTLSQTAHTICTTWKQIAPCTQDGLDMWAYAPLMLWTCHWASGAKQDDKAVCDALLLNLSKTGLCYGGLGNSDLSVPCLLHCGEGLCGAWHNMFQHLAHCQGIYVHKRGFRLDYQEFSPDEGNKCVAFPEGATQKQILWNTAVISHNGLNQPKPDQQERLFHENDDRFPIPVGQPAKITKHQANRYLFSTTLQGDTHAFNFLVGENGRLYLYDPCFFTAPFELIMELPEPNPDKSITKDNLAYFKQNYLDYLLSHLIGTIYNGSRSKYYDANEEASKGMAIKMPLISASCMAIIWQ